MAVERQVAAPAKVAKVAAKPAPKQSAAPAAKQAAPAAGTVAQIRADLSVARRDLALQKLDSPTKIRALRKDLARALTAERAKATTQAGATKAKEAA